MMMMKMMMIALLGLVLTVKKTEDGAEPKIRSKVSSAFTRFVGKIRIDVVNTKQNTDVPKKALAQKWAVLVSDGTKRKPKVHSVHGKKSDAITSLRQHEIELKAEDKS